VDRATQRAHMRAMGIDAGPGDPAEMPTGPDAFAR
jgi:hypothetical protein